MNLGKTIKDSRIMHFKGNQYDFAEALGITQSYLSLLENNKKKPSPDLIKKIGDVCEIPLVIMLWHSLDENDVSEDKKESFKLLKPSLDALLKEVFEPNPRNRKQTT